MAAPKTTESHVALLEDTHQTHQTHQLDTIGAKIAVAVSTAVYPHYARKQWEIMDDGLRQSRPALNAAIGDLR